MSLLNERDTLIKNWLKEAAVDIKESLKNELKVEVKSRRNDLVTEMDQKIERIFVDKIKSHYPNDKVVSEEGFGDQIEDIHLEEDTVWFLDPIDGTLNFVLQQENFVVMLAVYEKGIGQQAYIYDVMREELYWAIKDQGVYRNDQLLPRMKDVPLEDGLFASNSMYLSEKQVHLNAQITKVAMGVRATGSAGVESAGIVKNNTVAYVSFGLKPWDLAPGLMMVEENGGEVIRFDGSKVNLFESIPTIMGTPSANKKIREIINNI